MELTLPTTLEQEEGVTVKHKLEFVKIEETKWWERAEEETNLKKKAFCKSLVKLANLRLSTNQRPESEEAQSIVEEETRNRDPTRFQRFKEWNKKNLAGLSVVAISVVGIITTIVMGARNAVKRGASATSKFAKSLAKIAEKTVPVIGGLLNLAAKVITLGAKGIGFLSNHLWILAVAITYALYEQRRKKNTK